MERHCASRTSSCAADNAALCVRQCYLAVLLRIFRDRRCDRIVEATIEDAEIRSAEIDIPVSAASWVTAWQTSP